MRGLHATPVTLFLNSAKSIRPTNCLSWRPICRNDINTVESEMHWSEAAVTIDRGAKQRIRGAGTAIATEPARQLCFWRCRKQVHDPVEKIRLNTRGFVQRTFRSYN